jgi:superfamily I DNA/RNA helicase
MRKIEPPFQIVYQGNTANVTEAEIKERRVFYVQFTDARKPLTITVGEDRKEVKFWTSIPQGRQTEAEEIGKLIAAYIRSRR